MKQFAIQFHEFTLKDYEVLILAYVRFLHKHHLREKTLFTRSPEIDSKGETIFKVATYFEEKNIHLGNIIACATDDASFMIDRQRLYCLLKNALYFVYIA